MISLGLTTEGNRGSKRIITSVYEPELSSYSGIHGSEWW